MPFFKKANERKLSNFPKVFQWLVGASESEVKLHWHMQSLCYVTYVGEATIYDTRSHIITNLSSTP